MTKVLLKREVSPEHNAALRCPITWVVTNGNVELARRMFITSGVDLRPRPEGGDWPPALAMRAGNMEMVKLLLEHGGIPEDSGEIGRLYSEAERFGRVEFQAVSTRDERI
jgi:ankyrin repeat protein